MSFTGDTSGGARGFLPRTTLGWLILANLVVYFAQSWGFLIELRATPGGLLPMQFGSVELRDLAPKLEWWRLLTYMFVHDVPSPLHVGMNMLMVFVCGRLIEQRLDGRALLLIYLFGGILGALLQLIVYPSPPLIGASASAFAIMVVWAMLIPERKILALIGLVIPIRLKVKYLASGIILASVIFLAIDLAAGADAQIPMISHIGHLAHLGGALAGLIYAKWVGIGTALTREDLLRQRATREAGLEPAAGPPGGYYSGMVSIPPLSETDDFSMTEVDPILDKIAREGFLSLSEDEREILQRGLSRMSRS